MSNTAADVLKEAQSHVGTSGRPNAFTREYAKRHGDAFLRAAWCDMFVTFCARRVGASRSVLPAGDRAYTVWHADDFRARGAWKPGSVAMIKQYATPAAVVFFDWSGSNDIPAVDHVGYVIKNLGDGRVVTVEGNTGDAVRLRVRGADVIAGFGLPKYDPDKVADIRPVSKWPYKSTTLMRKGWVNSKGVAMVQGKINALGYRPKLQKDGDFGTKTEKAVKWFQKRERIAQDGIVGPITWGRLFLSRA